MAIPPGPGRPATLSRARILESAMRLDLRSFTMRELAAELGVSHGALYRWVGGRDEVIDLVGEAVVERILPADAPTAATWRDWLTRLAWAMHDEFLAVPGFAQRVARPHRHNVPAFEQLHGRVLDAFRVAGADAVMAEQSWYVFGVSVVSWLGLTADHAHPGETAPRFDLFLQVLLRGLPARE